MVREEDGKAGLQFVSWFNSGVAAAGATPGTITVHRESLGWEIVAARPLARGEEVVPVLPLAYVVRAEGNSSKQQRWLRSHFHRLLLGGMAPVSVAPLAAALLLELQDPSSPRRPMLDLLPGPTELRDVLDWNWNPSVAGVSSGDTAAGGGLLNLRAELFRTDRDAALAATATHTSASAARYATAIVASRGIRCGGGAVLLPTVGFMNHGGHKRNVDVSWNNCRHTVIRPIATGDPLRMDYGDRTCAQWLGSYGFVPAEVEKDPLRTEAVEISVESPEHQLRLTEVKGRGPPPPSAFIARLRDEGAKLCGKGFALRRNPPASSQLPMDGKANEDVRRLLGCWRLQFLARNWRPYAAAHGGNVDLAWWDVDVSSPLGPQEESLARQGCAEVLHREASRLRGMARLPAPAPEQAFWWQSVQRCARSQAALLDAWQRWLKSPWRSDVPIAAATVVKKGKGGKGSTPGK